MTTHKEETATNSSLSEVTTSMMEVDAERQAEADASGETFLSLFDMDHIQEIQDAFAKATGVASIITTVRGEPLTAPSNFCRLCIDVIRATEVGLGNCMHSDAIIGRRNPEGPIIQRCLSGGLFDGGASITVGDRHIANWLIGQVRNDQLDEPQMMDYAREIGADEEEFRSALSEVTVMPLEQFEAVGRALFLIANQMSETAFQSAQQKRHIAELKRAEQEQARLEGQLRQSQKMEAIGQLAGGVAHDFNNLLTGILGNAQLLEMELEEGSESRELADVIIRAGTRAADLTRQLLAFSRKGQLQTVNLDLHEVIAEVIKLLERSIDPRIEICCELGAIESVVHGDPTQLQNALLNLAVNARDAMPAGGELTFSTRNTVLDEATLQAHAVSTRAGSYLEVSVDDTGVGMNGELQSHIFEPFFTTKEEHEGTGLGLAGVYGCVKSHDGVINVYSELGQGSSFKVLLPLSGDAGERAEIVTCSAPIRGEGYILIIDDEEIVRNVAAKSLRGLGYVIATCSDGAEGIDFFRQNHREIDLVILDLIMPKLNGEETFVQMREIDPDVHVLVASGFSRNRVTNTLLEHGARGFLNKPFRIDELSQQVARCISR